MLFYNKRVASEREIIYQKPLNDSSKSQETTTKSAYKRFEKEKKSEIQIAKEEKLKNKKLKEELKMKYTIQNQLKRDSIRRGEVLGLKKMAAFQERKLKSVRDDHTMRMLNEQEIIRKQEIELERMEKLENKLIEKLKKNEEIQDKTLKKLADAIKADKVNSSTKTKSSSGNK